MDNEIWLRPWVWLDYKLAVIFTVVMPLLLLIWSLIRRNETVTHLLIIYWRVASLLMITVYLMIPGWWFGFVSGFVARLLIPVALWFWVDLNEEIVDEPPSLFKGVLTGWRWAVSVYCAIGTVLTVPFLSCVFSTQALATPFCRVWLEPPFFYWELLHQNSRPGFLGFLGLVGLIVYSLYFIGFLLTRLGKRGRSAMEQ